MNNINFNAKCTRFRDAFDTFFILINNGVRIDLGVYNMFQDMHVSTMRSIL
jgi:hypothetical protein